MAKSLIITEKPSVAQEFARILGVSGRNDGYIENDGYVITWCVGHLVEMVYPEEYDERYKKWRLEDLPFLPRDYKYNVIPSVSRQYDVVHKMLHREDIDTVYWAGDAGKEGQTIEENIRKFGGVREGMKELRVWIDSQTEEEILRGLREAKDMSEYDNLAKSGNLQFIHIHEHEPLIPLRHGGNLRCKSLCGKEEIIFRADFCPLHVKEQRLAHFHRKLGFLPVAESDHILSNLILRNDVDIPLFANPGSHACNLKRKLSHHTEKSQIFHAYLHKIPGEVRIQSGRDISVVEFFRAGHIQIRQMRIDKVKPEIHIIVADRGRAGQAE